MSLDVVFRPALAFGIANSLLTLGESTGVNIDQLIAEFGMGGALLVAFYWLVKGIRQQDSRQTRELTDSWQSAFERISEAQREAWTVQTELLSAEIKETRRDVREIKNILSDAV